jgi:hypothetical protein
MKAIFLSFAALLLAACTVNPAVVSSGGARPTLKISGAPEQSVLLVDSKEMGAANVFSGPDVLRVEEGAHLVEIRLGSTVVHRERVFVGSGENKIIDVR